MRTALTIGIHHGGEIVELLEGTHTPIEEQRARFKLARSAETHERFERIELWESDRGRTVHHRFREPGSSTPPVEPVAPPPAPPATSEATTETAPDEPSDAGEFSDPAGSDEAEEFSLGAKPKRPKQRKSA